MNEDEEVIEQESEGNIKTKAQLEDFYGQGFRNSRAAYLRFILMAFVCFWNFGFPEPTGIVSTISGFAIPCFYILSGYFILSDNNGISSDKSKRKIKRSCLFFAFMFLAYLLINIFVCGLNNIIASASVRSILYFAVLNLWPLAIGSNIWFIQAMLYAYIFIFIAEKLKLMRFYKAIMVVLFIFMLLSGELSGLVHFNILGFQFIPGNWFTRALPYILLGKFLREKEESLLKTAAWKFIVMWFIGALLALGEIIILEKMGLLLSEGHMIGYGIMALSACGLVISRPLGRETKTTAIMTQFDPVLSGIIYLLMDPLFYAIGIFLNGRHMWAFSLFGGLAAYALSILLAMMFKNSRFNKAFFS